MEKATSQRRHVKVGAGPAAAGLTEDGDRVLVATELVDVGLDPLEGGHQVPEALVARGIGIDLGLLVAKGGEAKWSESVVGGDDDDVPLYPGVGPVGPPAVNSITTTATLSSVSSHHSLPPLLKYPPKIQNMTGSLSPGEALSGV